jgi:hypothetical protein
MAHRPRYSAKEMKVASEHPKANVETVVGGSPVPSDADAFELRLAGMTYAAIASKLGRSETWARTACKRAQRKREAQRRGQTDGT